jgi:hypothetical protein
MAVDEREFAELKREVGQLRGALGATTADEAQASLRGLVETVRALSEWGQAQPAPFTPPVAP